MNPESLKPGDLCTWKRLNKHRNNSDVILFLGFAESFHCSFLFKGQVETVSYDFVRTHLRPLENTDEVEKEQETKERPRDRNFGR